MGIYGWVQRNLCGNFCHGRMFQVFRSFFPSVPVPNLTYTALEKCHAYQRLTIEMSPL